MIAVCGLLTTSADGDSGLQFTLPTLDGDQFSLRETLPNGPVLLDFWATWCKPCLKSLPKLQELAGDFEGNGLQVFTVNIDGPRNEPKIRPFLKRHRLELPVLLDRTNQLMKRFQLIAPPATVLISTEGTIVHKHVGYKRGDENLLRQRIEQLLTVPRIDTTKAER